MKKSKKLKEPPVTLDSRDGLINSFAPAVQEMTEVLRKLLIWNGIVTVALILVLIKVASIR